MLRFPLSLCLLSIGLTAAEPSKIPPVKFTETLLDNGLRVIIAEDHYAPIFGIAVSYAVGSKDERAGRTGFAHLFEHMMFKGSENVGAGEHFYLIYNNGGGMNGTTNTDRTLYFEVLPKNQIDLALFLEADRMRSLDITKENLDNQRQAVKEERRLRLDNQPYGQTNERITELAYENFAYKHSVIGSMADLDAASVEDVSRFFKTYYAPNNAVLALVGDLNTKETLEKVKKNFGGIPKQEAPKPVDLSEKPQTAERRERIEDRLARLARVDVAYKIPPASSKDVASLQVMSSILGQGESSRLYQKLVKEKEVAVQMGAFVNDRMGPGVYRIVAIVRPGKSPEEVESLISEEIAKLHGEPVTEKELRRARSSIRRGAVGSRQSALGRAIRLADDAVLFNDPGRINTEAEQLMQVSAAEIQAAVRSHLNAANRTVIVTVPAAKPAAAR
ncbi:MAG: insulinase family protein [Acidobacteriia bacterium]|nr:insulinase family protein [Terriglobia bacterium]